MNRKKQRFAPFLLRSSSITLVLLASCAAIEIGNNAQPVQIKVDETKAAPRNDSRTTDTLRAASPGATIGAALGETELTSGTLNITVERALVIAMGNNKSLKVEAINPAVRETFEAEQRAVFDPTLSANFSYG